jgi:hypothetical protein
MEATTHENSTTMRAYMGTAWCSMWWSLVLVYQPAVWGSCDGKPLGCSLKL